MEEQGNTNGMPTGSPAADLLLQHQQALAAAQRLGQSAPNLADFTAANSYDLALRAMMVGAQGPVQSAGQGQSSLSLQNQLLQTQYAQALQLLLANPASVMALQGAASLINPYSPYAAAAAFLSPQLSAFAPAMLLGRQLGTPSSSVPTVISTAGLINVQQPIVNGQTSLGPPGGPKQVPYEKTRQREAQTQSTLNRPGKPAPLTQEISILTSNGPLSAGIPPSPQGGPLSSGGVPQSPLGEDKMAISPEAMEQRISKLISDNEAIVQPSPVLIRKRNSRYYAPLGATKGNSTGSLSPRTGSDSSSGGQASSSPQMTVPADPSPFQKPFSGVSHTAPRYLPHQPASAPQLSASFRQTGGSITQGVPHGPPLGGHALGSPGGPRTMTSTELSRSTMSTAALANGEFLCPFCRLGFTTAESLRQHELRCGHPDADLHRRHQSSLLADALTKKPEPDPPIPRSHHPLKKRILAAAESFDLADTPPNNPQSPRNALCPTPPLVLDRSATTAERSGRDGNGTRRDGGHQNMTSLPQARNHLPNETTVRTTSYHHHKLVKQAAVVEPDKSGFVEKPGYQQGSMVILPQQSGQNVLLLLSQDRNHIPRDPYQLMLHQSASSVLSCGNTPVLLTVNSGVPQLGVPLTQSKTLAALSTILRPNISLNDAEVAQKFTPYTLCPSSVCCKQDLAGVTPPPLKAGREVVSTYALYGLGGRLGPMTSRLVTNGSSTYARYPDPGTKPFEAKWILTVMGAYDVRARNAFPLKYVLSGGSYGTKSKSTGSSPLTPTVVWWKSPEKGICAVPKLEVRIPEPQVSGNGVEVPKPVLGVKREALSPVRAESPVTPKRIRLFDGAYKSLEPYSYVKGRGKGRFMCEYCSIRCVKPSVLKKHLRTHFNVRPFTCGECHFAFKTKGNLTKHIKVKGHGNLEHGTENSQQGTEDSESLSADSGDDEGISFEEQRNHAIRLRKRNPGSKRRYSVSSLEPLLLPRDHSPEHTSFSRSCESAPPIVHVQTSPSKLLLPSPVLAQQPVKNELSREKQKNYLQKSTDEKCICSKCGKQCPTMGQLRLHMNVHFIESNTKRADYRCLRCSTTFRSKPAFMKHQPECPGQVLPKRTDHKSPLRGVPLVNRGAHAVDEQRPPSNPRPFACDDCNVAFRIHGHLAKHLRSKLHIMKLECQEKLPIGTYAKIEESAMNSLSEIDTTDCESSMTSLLRIAARLNLPTGGAKPGAPEKLGVPEQAPLQVKVPPNAVLAPPPSSKVNQLDVSCAIAMLDFARQHQQQNSAAAEEAENRLVIVEDDEDQEKPEKTGLGQSQTVEHLKVKVEQPKALEQPKPALEPVKSSAAEPEKKTTPYAVVADVWVPPTTVEVPIVSTFMGPYMGNSPPMPIRAIPDSKPVLKSQGPDGKIANPAENEKASCIFCAQDFESKIELKIHHLTVHIELKDGADYRCPQKRCEKVFPTAENLRQHLRKHFYNPHAFLAQFPASSGISTDAADKRPRPSSAHQFLASRPPSLQRQGPLSSKSLDSPELTSPEEGQFGSKVKSHLTKMDSFDSLPGFSGSATNLCRDSPVSDTCSECSADSTGKGGPHTPQNVLTGPPVLPLPPRPDFLPASVPPHSTTVKRRFEDPPNVQHVEVKKPRPMEPIRPRPITGLPSEPVKTGSSQLDTAYLLRAVAGCSPYLGHNLLGSSQLLAPAYLTTGLQQGLPATTQVLAPSSLPRTSTNPASLLNSAPPNPSSLLNSSQGSLNPSALLTAGQQGHGVKGQEPRFAPSQQGAFGGQMSQQQPSVCPLCGKGCQSISALQEHFLGHISARPFVCEQCDAGFTSQIALAAHARSHPKKW